MPIIENVGGVLRTHTAEFVNVGGVLKEQSTVTVNDGGVLRTVHSAKKVKIEGITPLVVAEDHIVITASGSGTISLPAGARIILGSGAKYTEGGYVAKYTLPTSLVNAPFTATVGNANIRYKDATKLIIDGITYGCGEVKQIINTKWGPIGGDGGQGFLAEWEWDSKDYLYPKPGTGAAGGGGSSLGSTKKPGGAGGNQDGYGNKGGAGGYSENINSRSDYYGRAGSSGSEQRDIGSNTQYGNGGSGGFAAGGGHAYYYHNEDDPDVPDDEEDDYGVNGIPGAGIIVFEW